MNVFFWNKKQLLKKNKVRFILYAIMPILVFVIFHIRNIARDTIGFSYVIITSSILNLAIFSIEDIAFSEAILGSPKTLKRVWLSNYFVNIVFTVFVSLIYFIAYKLLLDREQFWNHLGYAAIAALLSSSLQLLSLVHLSDYSKLKQWIASFSAIVLILYPLYILSTNKILVEAISLGSLSLGIAILSIIIIGSSFFLFGGGNPEMLILNTKPLLNSVKDNSNLIVE